MIVQAMMLQALGPEEMFRLMRIKSPGAQLTRTAKSPRTSAPRRRLVPAFAHD